MDYNFPKRRWGFLLWHLWQVPDTVPVPVHHMIRQSCFPRVFPLYQYIPQCMDAHMTGTNYNPDRNFYFHSRKRFPLRILLQILPSMRPDNIRSLYVWYLRTGVWKYLRFSYSISGIIHYNWHICNPIYGSSPVQPSASPFADQPHPIHRRQSAHSDGLNSPVSVHL